MTEVDERALLQELLERCAAAMGLECGVAITEGEDELRGTLEGDDLGLFIGRHGQTIDAVQHLAVRMIAHKVDRPTTPRRIVIDAEGYRARRADALAGQADKAADEALRFGRPVALDAMTASERRHVHEHLRDRGDVETHSEGEEPERHLVVSPKTT